MNEIPEFDRSKLTLDDYTQLSEAISRTGREVRFWYTLSDVFFLENTSFGDISFINKKDLIKQTGATSDFDNVLELIEHYRKNEEEVPYEIALRADRIKDKYNSVPLRLVKSLDLNPLSKRIFGINNLEICVYNPKNALPELEVGNKKAKLIQMDGNCYNISQGRVSFESGTAFLNIEDQDIAHRLGLMYAPSDILERDSLSPSNFELHKDKKKTDENGNPIIYCDNPCCEKQIRNPVLIVDEQTGGVYHNSTCFWKDMAVKHYVAREKGIELQPDPKKIKLEYALELYQKGKLQQSVNTDKTEQYRSLNPWPEGAMFFLP